MICGKKMPDSREFNILGRRVGPTVHEACAASLNSKTRPRREFWERISRSMTGQKPESIIKPKGWDGDQEEDL